MENSKTKKTMIVTVGLSLLAIALVCVQTLLIEERQPTVMNYYVANKEVLPYTKLSASMFDERSYIGEELPSGLVTDLVQVSGKYTRSIIAEGDLLTTSKLTSDTLDANLPYTMEIQASYMGDIVYGDVVDVYYFRGDEVPVLLYQNKKVYADKSLESNPVGQKVTQMYVRVTEREMKDYYKRLANYSFIIVPIEKAFIGQTAVSETPTPDKKENINNDPVIIINGEEVIMDSEWLMMNTEPYLPVEGDTKESIAAQYDTNAEMLDTLNQNKEVSIDEIYLVPLMADYEG